MRAQLVGGLADGAIDTLMTYNWPGNVRELENVVERGMILHRNELLDFDDLGVSSSQSAKGQFQNVVVQSLELDVVNARHIAHVLDMTGGKIHGPGGAAEILGLNPSTLRTKMKKLGIPFKKG